MEEGSESHMETDVSSTTEDVPETQEVTGSNGDVEMVIVIEKVTEEEMNTTEQTDKPPPENKVNSVSKQPIQSPVKTVQAQTFVESPNKGEPPKSVQKSPVKPETPKKVTVKDAILIKTPLPFTLKHAEPADSSSKIDVQKLLDESKEKIVDSSLKDTEVQNITKSTPTKDKQMQESTKITPEKESIVVDKSSLNGKVQSAVVTEQKEEASTSVTTVIPIDITIEREASNDSQESQVESNTESSEKDHNKSISRELKSLIKSAKESKIISECNQLTSKTRKSRVALDASLNSSVEADKIQGNRRSSDNSQKSNCSEKSEKITLKRSMRSQNPEFVSKVKQFLNSVTGKVQKDSDVSDDDMDDSMSKEKVNKEKETKKESDQNDSMTSTPKKKKLPEEPTVQDKNKLRTDSFCWRCHWAVEQTANEKTHSPMQCTVCPRSFHFKCLSGTERNKIVTEKNWVCPECIMVLQAESSDTRSHAMKKISLGKLCELLKFALERMMDLNGVEPFMNPVDRVAFPDYDKYVVHPMDLSLMKDNIVEGLYGSTEAFLADTQWILHNSVIFNTINSKLTGVARALVRYCRAEMGEVEACPECYAAAHARRPTWFTDVCTTPHILLWAKLKGFPYWPAKGMSVNGAGLVDVRFFGAHDRAWVPAKDCFLYSEKDPNNFRTKRQDILDSMQEAEQHIRNISRKYGKFVYPPFKTQFDPTKLYEQLRLMIPSFEGEVKNLVKEKPTASPNNAKEKSRSNSKSSKGSGHEGDMSESEETAAVPSRKMADGAEIAMEDDDANDKTDKEKNMEVDKPEKNELSKQAEPTSTRKRRRSELEEAIFTIMESSSPATVEKRKRVDEEIETQKKDSPEPSSSKDIVVKPEVTIDKLKLTVEKPKATVELSKVTVEKPKVVVEKPKGAIEKPKVANDTPKDSAGEGAAKANNAGEGTPIVKDNEPSSSTVEKDNSTPKVAPIKIFFSPKTNKQTPKPNTPKENTPKTNTPKENTPKTNTPKENTPKINISKEYTPKTYTPKENTPKTNTPKENTPKTNTSNEKTTPNRQKPARLVKSLSSEKIKDDKSKSVKRRISRNKSQIIISDVVKTEKPAEKKNEKNADNSTNNKEKAKENNTNANTKNKEVNKSTSEKHASKSSNAESPKSSKDRIIFDDDTSLAVLARGSKNTVISSSATGLPTISSVRSLSTTAQNTTTTSTKTTTTPKTIEITIDANTDSSIFTPTSTSNVRNMSDAVNKLQKLRNETEPVVGRVGVRAFARMTSPPPEKQNKPDDVQVEIKSEPIDLDEPERHSEKMDLMNAFRLRPVNPQPTNLREVRINKVVVTPLNARKATKTPEVRPRAKKTFPQPKKNDDGRSELNSKNSMVYIPIQPPMTQAPVRAVRPSANGTVTSPVVRPTAPIVTSVANNLVNTVTTPMLPAVITSTSTLSSPSVTSTPTSMSTQSMHSVGQVPTVGQVSTVGQVPTVHTVPLVTSVNGQLMFSLHPVMSVGSIENGGSPPMMNGLPERSPAAPMHVAGAALPALMPSALNPNNIINTPTNCRTPVDNTTALGEPPRLQQRPALLNPLDSSTPIGSVPPPSTAGPLTAKLNQNAVKLTDFFRTLLEDSLEKLDEPATQATTLRLQLEQARWKHAQEIQEIKHNHELTLAEMRASFDKEKLRAVSEVRRSAQVELESAIKLAKSKQWCANCSQEAQFYCCWNTSYCDYPCQRAHWSQHFSVCTQQRAQDGNSGNEDGCNPPESRLQPQPENLPKSAPTPTLTVGGKLAPSRVYTQEQQNTQKASIIVSMVENSNGNQVKCVGTYKQPESTQMTPLLLNKQIMNNEDAAKKVVTSGGYLIVGAGAGAPNNTSVVTPSRRTHTIQYYT